MAAWPLPASRTEVVTQVSARSTTADEGSIPLPLLSLNVPAYASASAYAPADGDDYSAAMPSWRSAGPTPVWLAYDLSRVPLAQRRSDLVVWYNTSYEYDYGMDPQAESYNLPQTYTLETNTAPGGGAPPSTGWTTVASVSGNYYHSRQHLVSLGGANWLRLDIAAVRGSALNYDAAVKMDVYDASLEVADDFIFYGDSITVDAMNHTTAGDDTTDWLGALVHARAPTHYPVVESGGIPYLTTGDGATRLGAWLGLFPGHYVGLSYGTNDANACEAPGMVYSHLVTMAQAVLGAGKVPLMPHIPYGTTANIRACGPSINAQIDALCHAYPQVIPGPDLWAYFKAHPALISRDGIHPTDAGDAALREQWADLIVGRLYEAAPLSASPPTATDMHAPSAALRGTTSGARRP